MAIIERSDTVRASPQQVWEVLSDFAAISAWAPNVDHSCLTTDRAEGVGATRRIQTDRTTLLETVVSWEPELTLSYDITGLPPVIKSVTNTWSLAADGGQTTISLVSNVDAGQRPPQKLIAKVAGKRLAAASEQMIAGLIAAVEGAES